MPPPACEMPITVSTLNVGSLVYSFSALTCLSVMPSLSNSTSDLRKLLSVIIALAPVQLMSFFALRMHTHSHTFCTLMLGLAKDLSSVMSSLRRLLSASAASSSAGIAAARSASASSFSMAMRALSTLSCSSLAPAICCLPSTMLVLVVITSSSSFTSLVLASTTTLASDSVFCITATSSAAWISFCRPPLRRAASSPISTRLSTRLFL
mmetsp:Transcript_14108/g.33882  ORF Transcript_14108/g.33882 Transcript_14108/m.33882 type:complete len:209 (+) Transcript_14108:4118-4744(+)